MSHERKNERPAPGDNSVALTAGGELRHGAEVVVAPAVPVTWSPPTASLDPGTAQSASEASGSSD